MFKYEAKYQKKENEIQLRYYQEIKEKYKETDKLLHDIRKHLRAIRELKQEDRERAEQYCGMIETEIGNLYHEFKCSNTLLEIIMSEKILSAKELNIKIKTEVEDLPLEFMSDVDMTAIFANLWDNAIEACREVEEEKRFITVVMRQAGGMILLNMKNSYNGELRRNGQNLKSTKEGHKGLGIGIMRQAVQRYEGVLNMEQTEDTFLVRITMRE